MRPYRTLWLWPMLLGCAQPALQPARPATVAALPSPPAPAPLAWPSAASCRGLVEAVLAMPEAERAALDPATAPLAVGMADAGPLLPRAEVERAVELDLPVRVAETLEVGDCTLLLARPQTQAASGRRLVGHEVVRSERRAGSRRSANPDYRRLRDREEAEERGPLGSVMATGDPALDLVGLIAGSLIRGVGRLVTARRAEPEVERTLETPVYEPYTYEISEVEVAKAGVTPLVLYAREPASVAKARYEMPEERVFRVAKGRHRADRGVLDDNGPLAVLPGDVDAFEGAPVRPRLSALLQSALLAPAGQGTFEQALAALKEGPAPALAIAGSGGGTVRIAAMGGEVTGTWLDATRISAPVAGLGRSGLVEIQDGDGQRRFGLVEQVDHASGLAVIRVGSAEADLREVKGR